MWADWLQLLDTTTAGVDALKVLGELFSMYQ
jgi:hypothetical protein